MPLRISGRFVDNTIKTWRSELGTDRFQFLITRCPPMSAALLQRNVLVEEWIDPDTWYAAYDVLMREVLGNNSQALVDIARVACRRLLTRPEKLLLRWVPRYLALKAICARWISSLDGASAEVSQLPRFAGRRQFGMQMRRMPKHAAFPHAMRGFLLEILHHTGAQNLEISLVDMTAGDFRLVISFD